MDSEVYGKVSEQNKDNPVGKKMIKFFINFK